MVNHSLTATAEPNCLIEPVVDLLRRPEVPRRACYVDEFSCRDRIPVYLDHAGSINVQMVIEDVIAALEGVKVPSGTHADQLPELT